MRVEPTQVSTKYRFSHSEKFGRTHSVKNPFAYMPSAFAYLPPASHALQFIVCYQQFTIMMFFTSLLISLPYSPVRVTSRDGCSLNFTKTFYIMLRFTRIVRPGPSFFSPIIGRIPLKSVSRFIFVCSRRCKNSTPAFPLAYKSTAAVCVWYVYISNRYSVANLLQSSRNHVCFCCFSLFIAFAF